MFKGYVILSLLIASFSAVSGIEKISARKIFVPQGVDSNDLETIIVLTGELPNTCYRLPTATVHKYTDSIEIELTATKITGDNLVCIMAQIPYTLTVDLGNLQEGQYDINVNSDTIHHKTAQIRIATAESTTVDTYNYAHITNVTNHGNVVEIEGYHPSSCMRLERVEVMSNENGDTFSILPIISGVENEVCDDRLVPFSITLELPTNEEQVLLHIRTIDGSSKNKVVSFTDF